MKVRMFVIAGLAAALVATLGPWALRARAQEHMGGMQEHMSGMHEHMGGMHQMVDVDQMITSAKTAADHEAIAKHFADKASDREAVAARHRKMAETYKKVGGAAIEKWHLDAHCENLARSDEAAAKEYQALAEAHRELAKSVGK